MVHKLNREKLGEIVISVNKIEKLLRENGAEGEGIHELYQSISHKLSSDIVKKLKNVTYFRNNTSHYNPKFNPDNNQLKKSLDEAQEIIIYLEKLLNPKSIWDKFFEEHIEPVIKIIAIGGGIMILLHIFS